MTELRMFEGGRVIHHSNRGGRGRMHEERALIHDEVRGEG